MATQLLCGNLRNPSSPLSLLQTWEIFMELMAELESETSAVYKALEKCHYQLLYEKEGASYVKSACARQRTTCRGTCGCFQMPDNVQAMDSFWRLQRSLVAGCNVAWMCLSKGKTPPLTVNPIKIGVQFELDTQACSVANIDSSIVLKQVSKILPFFGSTQFFPLVFMGFEKIRFLTAGVSCGV